MATNTNSSSEGRPAAIRPAGASNGAANVYHLLYESNQASSDITYGSGYKSWEAYAKMEGVPLWEEENK